MSQARASRDGENGGINDQKIGGPRNGSEICGDRLDAAKHQPFRTRERGNREPSGARKRVLTAAQKLENENRDRCGRVNDAELHHAAKRVAQLCEVYRGAIPVLCYSLASLFVACKWGSPENSNAAWG